MDHSTKPYYGLFTVDREAFCLEGHPSDDCLCVSRLTSPTDAAPVCLITGKDRNQSHELLMQAHETWTDAYRRRLIFAAIDKYRMWLVDGPQTSLAW